jgi:cellulose synthase/poly-beta-1,6-N-acetylglucosamine synthase-like glycosyltransferase
MILITYAVAILLFWTFISIYLIFNTRKITYLKDVPAPPAGDQPSVAIVIAVKNEEAEIEEALRSVCKLDYTNYRVVVVNDRSTDRTPEILRRMQSEISELTVLHVEELPVGWLGKNHALYKGAQATTEEWILFTDADVLFAPGSLRKAMHYVHTNGLDHLTALPQVTSRSSLFKAVMNTFALMLDIKLRPWEIANSESKASMGVGAFNLVRREAYEQAGTHKVISLRPDDDLKLGERLKAAGFKQDVVYGEGELQLEWYTSLGQFVKGLMKNTFSVSNYRITVALGSALITFLLLVLPLPLLFLSGFPFYLVAAIILAAQIVLMRLKRGIIAEWWHALLIPFSGLVMVYIIIQSALLTLRRGGIYWRDSFYPLSELRKQV